VGRDLNALASYFLPRARAFIADCAATGVPVRVVDTDRTRSEQQTKLAQGVSWTTYSKHEPQPPEQKSEALDVVPKAILEEHKPNWDPDNPLWLKIGEIGEAHGMEWGGRWKHVNNGKGDPSHFQYKRPPAQVLTDPELSTT
jgi:hypothetical protein